MFGEPAGKNPSSPGKGHGMAPRPQHRCPIPIPLPPCRYGEGIGARGGSSGCPTAPHGTPRHPTAPQEEQLAAPWGCGAAVKVQLRFFARGAMATFPTWFNYGRLLPLQGGGLLVPCSPEPGRERTGTRGLLLGLVRPGRAATKPISHPWPLTPHVGTASSWTRSQQSPSLVITNNYPPTVPDLGPKSS